MIKINKELLDEIIRQARTSPRKRKNHNFHQMASDPLQRMLNAMNPGTYVQPHKHSNPPKREAFIILTGRIAVVEFDDHGTTCSSIILDRNTGNHGVEISENTWHTLISLEENSVVYELKDGPYSTADDKNFAPWAPAENAPGNKCEYYLKNLSDELGL